MRSHPALRAIIAACVLAAGSVAVANAQQPPATPPASPTPAAPAPPAVKPVPPPSWFVEMDTDKDGYVTRAEFLAARMRRFDALDTDHDGFLTLAEFLKIAEPPFFAEGPNAPPMPVRLRHFTAEFESMDVERNGKLSREEMQAYAAIGFDKFDLDKDDRISVAEVLNLQPPEPPPLPEGAVSLPKFLEVELRNMRELDTNKDGKISLDEFMALAGPPDKDPKAKALPPLTERRARVLAHFKSWDLNQDGFLDRDELIIIFTQRFSEIDRNRDGIVTQEEVAAHIAEEQKRQQEQPQPTAPAPAVVPTAPAPTPAPAPKPPQAAPRPAPAPAPSRPPPPTTLRPGG